MEREGTPREATRTPTGPESPPRRDAELESRGQRARRHGRRGRLYTEVVVALVLIGLLVAWVLANRDAVEVDWLVGSTDVALALVIFVAAALGWALGIATSVVIRRRTRRPR